MAARVSLARRSCFHRTIPPITIRSNLNARLKTRTRPQKQGRNHSETTMAGGVAGGWRAADTLTQEHQALHGRRNGTCRQPRTLTESNRLD